MDRIERANNYSKSEWKKRVNEGAYGFIGVANGLKPIIDIFIPQNPEYSVPYACLWIVFKVRMSLATMPSRPCTHRSDNC
jgi:hypothetical protein